MFCQTHAYDEGVPQLRKSNILTNPSTDATKPGNNDKYEYNSAILNNNAATCLTAIYTSRSLATNWCRDD